MAVNGAMAAMQEDGNDGGTSYTFTCGKIDAGIAVLIGSHAHLIEFPSLLLPPGCEPGSIVNITCARNLSAEQAQAQAFWDLQGTILERFGTNSPTAPQLRLRGATQTSVTLEWDALELANAKLISLAIWRNGQRVASIPNPSSNLSTKLSGLDLDYEYSFHLVLKTTAGSFNSRTVKVKTHSLNDTSGVNVCLGSIAPSAVVEEMHKAIAQMQGRWTDRIQLDTTHFCATSPTGTEYQRAIQLSIPVVKPSWVLACRDEKRMANVGSHLLGSTSSPTGPNPASAQPSVAPLPTTSPPATSASSPLKATESATEVQMEVPSAAPPPPKTGLSAVDEG